MPFSEIGITAFVGWVRFVGVILCSVKALLSRPYSILTTWERYRYSLVLNLLKLVSSVSFLCC